MGDRNRPAAWRVMCADGSPHSVLAHVEQDRAQLESVDADKSLLKCGPHCIESLYAAPPALREALERIAKPCAFVDMADPIEQQLEDALHGLSVLRNKARAALAQVDE